MPPTKRDIISTALFTLLQSASGTGANQFNFQTFVQRAYAPDDVKGVGMPIGMLVKTEETIIRNQETGRGLGLTKYRLSYKFLIYDQVSMNTDPTEPIIPEQEVNAILNALDSAFTPSSPTWMGERQTLGGLVEDAWIEGNIEIAQPIMDRWLIISIPIHILAGRIQVEGQP